jgi:hypothetical protein
MTLGDMIPRFDMIRRELEHNTPLRKGTIFALVTEALESDTDYLCDSFAETMVCHRILKQMPLEGEPEYRYVLARRTPARVSDIQFFLEVLPMIEKQYHSACLVPEFSELKMNQKITPKRIKSIHSVLRQVMF